MDDQPAFKIKQFVKHRKSGARAMVLAIDGPLAEIIFITGNRERVVLPISALAPI